MKTIDGQALVGGPAGAGLSPAVPHRAGSPWDLLAGSRARAWSRGASRGANRGGYGRGPKRALDLLLVALLALPVLMTVLPLMALVALDGHAPLFLQARRGRGGRVFRMVKLRTMRHDAEAVLEATLAADPAARAEWDRDQKLRHDPRITPVGRLLRRTSLDELPQLLNVALGQMSMVGPRPMLPSQRPYYPGDEYFSLRPGITGLWQVSVRNEASFAERAGCDRRYLESLSLGADLAILGRTFGVVLAATGR